MATAGLIFIAFIVLVAIFAPQIALYDPDAINIKNRLAPLNAAHPFGTDAFGRDLFSRVVFGSRISVIAGVGSFRLSDPDEYRSGCRRGRQAGSRRAANQLAV